MVVQGSEFVSCSFPIIRSFIPCHTLENAEAMKRGRQMMTAKAQSIMKEASFMTSDRMVCDLCSTRKTRRALRKIRGRTATRSLDVVCCSLAEHETSGEIGERPSKRRAFYGNFMEEA